MKTLSTNVIRDSIEEDTFRKLCKWEYERVREMICPISYEEWMGMPIEDLNALFLKTGWTLEEYAGKRLERLQRQ